MAALITLKGPVGKKKAKRNGDILPPMSYTVKFPRIGRDMVFRRGVESRVSHDEIIKYCLCRPNLFNVKLLNTKTKKVDEVDEFDNVDEVEEVKQKKRGRKKKRKPAKLISMDDEESDNYD